MSVIPCAKTFSSQLGSPRLLVINEILPPGKKSDFFADPKSDFEESGATISRATMLVTLGSSENLSTSIPPIYPDDPVIKIFIELPYLKNPILDKTRLIVFKIIAKSNKNDLFLM